MWKDCNEWELASWTGLDGVSKSQWWASTTAFTRPKEVDTQLHSLRMEGRAEGMFKSVATI
jgi:hypothetical protein